MCVFCSRSQKVNCIDPFHYLMNAYRLFFGPRADQACNRLSASGRSLVLGTIGWRSQQGTWRGSRPEALTPSGARDGSISLGPFQEVLGTGRAARPILNLYATLMWHIGPYRGISDLIVAYLLFAEDCNR